jgi:hypothetical protein
MVESTDTLADLSHAPMTDAGRGQRATNLALATGFNLHGHGVAPDTPNPHAPICPRLQRPHPLRLGGPGRRSPKQNLVGASSGTLSAFEWIEGAEVELDWDDAPSTTDADAPAGVTRVVLGAAPRQMALLQTARYPLLTNEAGLEIVDLETRVPVDTLTADDSTAFVSVWGSPSGPATSEVLVIDLSDLLSGGAPDASWVIASVNTDAGTNNQLLEASHDGSALAVVCPDTDGVRLHAAAAPYSAIATLTEYSFVNPRQNHVNIAWAPDDSAVFVGYIGGPVGSSIEICGNVCRCNLANLDNCEHAVLVSGTIRSIAVAGEGSNLVVWAADSLGGLTGLPAALFDPGTATSGVGSAGTFDGTGGCLSNSGQAVPCAAAASLGKAADDMAIWGD